MLKRLLRWREDRALARLDLDDAWLAAVADWQVVERYGQRGQAHLKDTALRFLLQKQFVGGRDTVVTDAMRLKVATMAAVPVLNIGLDWYRGWSTVVIYEEAFIPTGDWEDEYGIVHARHEPLSGEAWLQGPVILSWEDVQAASSEDGYNVVIHEMAHKLDMLSEGPNGAPPLHRDMNPDAWRREFTHAWDELTDRVKRDLPVPVDPYALEDTGEFFAVVSECFFEAPQRLQEAWPDVYGQLTRFYRQDPLERVH